MPQHSPTAVACQNSHRLMLEAIRLRDRLVERLDEADLDLLAQFDRIYRALGAAEHRIMRRRVRWLRLQIAVFEELSTEASQATRARLHRDLTLAALQSLAAKAGRS